MPPMLDSLPHRAAPRANRARLRTSAVRMLLLATGWLMLGTSSVAQSAPAEGQPAGTVTAKLMRYCERIVRRHDANGDGHLDAQEWSSMRGQPATADLNGDGQLTVEEFARYAANYGSGRRIRLSTRPDAGQEPSLAGGDPTSGAAPTDNASSAPDRRRDLRYFAPLANGTPGWFVERDADGDAQLTLSEFSPRLRATEVAEFKRYDINGDGLLTAAELARAVSKPAATATPSVPANQVPATP
jgi:hypothetical protein